MKMHKYIILGLVVSISILFVGCLSKDELANKIAHEQICSDEPDLYACNNEIKESKKYSSYNQQEK